MDDPVFETFEDLHAWCKRQSDSMTAFHSAEYRDRVIAQVIRVQEAHLHLEPKEAP